MINSTFSIFLLSLLISCATLNESDCKNGMWELIGQKDGTLGKPLSIISQHQDACSKYDIPIDIKAYKNGRKEGLKQYCLPKNGMRVGLSGDYYHNVCPSNEFNQNFKIGRNIYDMQKEIEEIENEIDRLEDRLDTKDLKSETRRNIRRNIRQKKRELRTLENKLLVYKATKSEFMSDLVDLIN